MPDQNRHLHSPSELRRDGGISDALKDICHDIGQDVRGKLLLTDLEEVGAKKKLEHLAKALTQALPAILSEAHVIDDAIKHLAENLPEDEECDGDSVTFQHGTVHLLDNLWSSQGAAAAATARKVPLIAGNQYAVRWSHDRMMMA